MTRPVVSTTPKLGGDRKRTHRVWHSAGIVRCLGTLAFTVTSLGMVASVARAESPGAASVEFFEKRVRPVLVEKCQRCHGQQSPKGGLSLVSREGLLKGGESGPVINSQHPEKSELVRAINYEADGFQMPPTGKLDAETISALTTWIREGAPWPEQATIVGAAKPVAQMDFAQRSRHWAFQPLQHSAPPFVAKAKWSRNPVDVFLEAQLHAAGCNHAAEADRRTLLRRITFDLIGLPPTRAEINSFLADDSPRAYENVVTRLLASPHYGARWGRHWLDLVRFAETAGHEFDYPIAEAWRYRDYVVRAFNDDLPYDQFVTEQVAGDLLGKPRRNPLDRTNESILATAFWWFGQAKHSPVDLRAEECDRLDNQIDVMGKAFLGLSIACARCHDHKFDAIRAQDYYALTGFLRSSRQQLAFLGDPRPAEQFANWRTECEPRLVELSGRTLNPHSWNAAPAEDNVVRPWYELKSVPTGAAFVAERKRLADQFNQRTQRARLQESQSTLFDGFTSASSVGWRCSGSAFGGRPSRAGDFVLGTSRKQPVLEFAESGAVHSGLVSPRLRGALRSKSFAITKPYIHYRATRHQSDGGPARPYKFGQINLVVDGFQIIREPLYGPLSVNVENDAPAAWYSQNVTKLIGNRAYIEIVDEDDGWISVDSIRFSDDPHSPVDRPNELIAVLLNDATIDNAAKLGTAYAKLFEETVAIWKSGRLADDPFARARVAILNSLCSHSTDPSDPHDARELTKLLDENRRRESELVPSPRGLALADGSAENDHVLVRGNHRKPGEEVARRFLEVFHGTPISEAEPGSGRLVLAHSLTGSAAPLLARVIVNRLWHHHFGRGLVASTDDFGKMGELPSNPELLDYLAGELIRCGWSIKHVQRLLVTSAGYRMSSREPDERSEAVDPQNRLVHRATVSRLEAEAIRDSILAISGRLDERLAGPSVRVHLDEFMTGRGRPAESGPLDGGGRRSVYLEVRRNFLTPLFLAFDFPIPATAAGRRAQSNVPAQALSLLNDPFVSQQAHTWAKRALAHPDSDPDALIDQLYETAFARLPTADERALSKGFLRQANANGGLVEEESLAELCHVLINVKEFLYIN